MEEYKFDCGGCSNACPLVVKVQNDEVVSVEGNCCRQAERYAKRKINLMKEKIRQRHDNS